MVKLGKHVKLYRFYHLLLLFHQCCDGHYVGRQTETFLFGKAFIASG